MLFNSYEFILGFFPIVFLGFFLIGRRSQKGAAIWLGLASLFFYGWWNYRYVPLLVGSILMNYWLGNQISPPSSPSPSEGRKFQPGVFLAAGVGANLLLLFYYKYENFFVTNVNPLLLLGHWPALPVWKLVLPLGISFYTFTQIAYLIDRSRGEVAEQSFWHYLLFVTFFPHLIAGPVLHHRQMLPQFALPETYRMDFNRIAVGLTLFTIGLAKKLLVADPLGGYVDFIFQLVDHGRTPLFFLSWLGALGYTFQIYLDFSGYTDMALGLSLSLGIHLPINFDAPYRSTNVIDFWQRWHMSLTRFLRDYVYIPLGGNRLGRGRQALNVLTTMLLSGLWHGAGWTYIIWGGIHGLCLVINHLWKSFLSDRGGQREGTVQVDWWNWPLTFACICFAYVFFRADSMKTAWLMTAGMLGLNGISLPESWARWVPHSGAHSPFVFLGPWENNRPGDQYFPLLVLSLIICFVLPSSTRVYQEGVNFRWGFLPLFSRRAGVLVGILLVVSIFHLSAVSRFLYFQF